MMPKLLTHIMVIFWYFNLNFRLREHFYKCDLSSTRWLTLTIYMMTLLQFVNQPVGTILSLYKFPQAHTDFIESSLNKEKCLVFRFGFLRYEIDPIRKTVVCDFFILLMFIFLNAIYETFPKINCFALYFIFTILLFILLKIPAYFGVY